MKKGLIVVLVAIVVVAVVGFLIFNKSGGSSNSANLESTNPTVGGSNTQASGGNSPTKIINLDAQRFQYTPNTITVKKGDIVKIVMNNIDTTHGIAIPDFGVSGVDSVQFTADKAGTFEFHCPTMCGSGHKEMTGTLIVQA